MNRYTVVWDPELESDFIGYWIQADTSLRAALTHASNWIDTNLAVNPETQGRTSAVDATCRSLLVPDTGAFSIFVLYRVIPEDRQVEVLDIQHILNK